MVAKKTILKWTFTTLWVAVCAAVVVLLVAAIRKEEKQQCSGITVNIKGVSNNFFVDKNDILNALNEFIDGSPVGQPVGSFNLKAIENELQKNIWVKKVQLFFDNNARLQVDVLEREPVARLFTNSGTTFYIDSSITMLPLSEKFSARLPVFTNFPSDKAVLTKADSALLKEVLTISMAIQKDSFRMAMIDQVDITAQRTFELVPKIGNTVIVFGDAVNAEEKFDKLLLFYKEVLTKSGWDYYSTVNVEYAGQVVAKRKGAEDKSADSLRTLQLMQLIAYNSEQLANDSLQMIAQDNERNTTDVNLIQQSIQRDDNAESFIAVETAKPLGVPVITKPVMPVKPPVKKTVAAQNHQPTAKPQILAPIKKPVTAKPKPATVKPVTNNIKPVNKSTIKPKAVMPKQNDY